MHLITRHVPGMIIAAAAAVTLSTCSPSRGSDRGQALREGLPVDTVNGRLDTVLGWQHRTELAVDLNGDGRTELLLVASDVSLTDGGEPLWEDGHRWAVYVEDSTKRTLLYSRFLPHGTAEVAVATADSDGSRDVLIQERTPQHSRAMVVEYERAGSARLVSDANYPLDRWLPSLMSLPGSRGQAARGTRGHRVVEAAGSRRSAPPALDLTD